MVSASVVQTSGACQRTNGGCGTGRGRGMAVRPPTVCRNTTDPPPEPSPATSADRITGRPTAANVTPPRASRTVVSPISSPDRSPNP